MTAIESIWDRVALCGPEGRRRQVPDLRAFLAQTNNPHAALLSGREMDGSPDETSAQELEAAIIAVYRARKLSKMELADWLRLLHDVRSHLQRESGPGEIIPAPTRLAAIPSPVPSPFSPAAMEVAGRVDHWRQGLHDWIRQPPQDRPRQDWQTAILLSAMLHGALLDTVKVKGLLERLLLAEPLMVASGYAHMDFDLPFEGIGNHHLQRWFPDPITEMLICGLPPEGANLAPGKLLSQVRRLLTGQGVAKDYVPRSLADLQETLSTWWSGHAAQIDIQAIRRRFTTHSIHTRSWSRFQGMPATALRVRQPSETPREEGVPALTEDLFLLHPWLAESLDQLDGPDRAAVQESIGCLTADNLSTPLAPIYLGWLEYMLAGSSLTRDALALSTLRRRYTAVMTTLLPMLGDESPLDLSGEALEDLYSEAIHDADPAVPVRDIAAGLRDFHAYLVQRHKRRHLSNLTRVLGDEARLLPVEANLISFDDYRAAQAWFDARLAEGRCPVDVTICKLVMALAFRGGMRRMEIFGLRIEDIQVGRGLVCLIRPHAGRRLKTRNASRLLPLQALLDWRERKLLTQWLLRRAREVGQEQEPLGKSATAYVFATGGGQAPLELPPVEGVVDRICEALRAVTGDRKLYLHHLRHAFATWTYLRLRAPDYPMVAELFDHLPETARAIRGSARLRQRLLGHSASPSRAYAFAVARLLGHSSPAVSMGHYVHASDLILAAIVHREINQVPRAVLIAASGLSQSQAYAYLQDSPHQLTVAVRRRHAGTVVADAPGEMSAPERKPRGRPRKPPAHQRADWLSLDKVWSVLHLHSVAQLPIQTIASQLAATEAQVTSILCEAWRHGPLIGLVAEADPLIPCPDKLRYPAEHALARTLEASLADLARRAPLQYRDGVELHLWHYNRQKHDVVFKGRKEFAAMKRYLRFLEALGMEYSRCQWVVRRPEAEGPRLPEWVALPEAAWRPERIRRIAPPSLEKASSYAQWVGIQAVDERGDGLGKAMASVMFLAWIAMQGGAGR